MGTHGATLILKQTTPQQSIANATYTALNWDTVEVDSQSLGTWWSSGAASEIQIPWTGPWIVSLGVLFDEHATGLRCVYLNQGTTVSTSNFRAGACIEFGEATESNIAPYFNGVLMLTAGTYKVACYQNSGGALLTETQHSYGYNAKAAFTYLGD